MQNINCRTQNKETFNRYSLFHLLSPVSCMLCSIFFLLHSVGPNPSIHNDPGNSSNQEKKKPPGGGQLKQAGGQIDQGLAQVQKKSIGLVENLPFGFKTEFFHDFERDPGHQEDDGNINGPEKKKAEKKPQRPEQQTEDDFLVEHGILPISCGLPG